jgi:hypothetical protein
VDLAPSPQAEKELKDLGIDYFSVKANVTDYNQVKDAVNSVIGVCPPLPLPSLRLVQRKELPS